MHTLEVNKQDLANYTPNMSKNHGYSEFNDSFMQESKANVAFGVSKHSMFDLTPQN